MANIKSGLGPDHIVDSVDISAAVPVGCIMMWATATAPEGWLICNGQATSSYPDLKAVVGDNVPDLRDRVPVGLGPTTFKDLKGHAGSNSRTHTLTKEQMPVHAHTHNTHNNHLQHFYGSWSVASNGIHYSTSGDLSGGLRFFCGKTTYNGPMGTQKNVKTSEGNQGSGHAFTYYPTQASTTLNFIIKAVA